jgi:hypothetical protein
MNTIKEYFTRLPLFVTIASLFVLCITTWIAIRVCATLINWDVLSRFNGNPAYIFATGLVWVIAGLALLVMLVNGEQFALRVGLILSMVYIIWYWFDRLVIQVSPTDNVTFSIVSSVIVFAIFNIILFWPSSRGFFTSARRTGTSARRTGARRQDEQ